MKKNLKLLAPAKINLWLEVVRKRPDGYHDLSTLMIPLDWGDEIILGVAEEGISLRCSDKTLGEDKSNLAYRAAETFFEALRKEKLDLISGIRIELVKKIPVGAGLGGGSSDAATVIKGLNILCGKPLSHDELLKLALFLGADVPFFIEARPALATGVGEKLRYLKTRGEDREIYPMWFVIVKPDFEVSTAEAYSKIKLTRRKDRISITCLRDFRTSLPRVIRNDLEEVVLQVFPEIGRIKKALLEEGAIVASMTGSGSAVFGVFVDEPKAVEVKEKLARRWPEYFVIAARGAY